ncbi:MAG: hypothetical protein AAB556_00405, partial [Patescibacteria group bacterium]
EVKEAGAFTKPEAQKLPAGTLIKLSSDAVSSFSASGTTTRYHKNIAENPGHLFEREADGSNQEIRISNFTIPQILDVTWSKNSQKAVIFYNLNNEVRKILVDYSESAPKTNFLPDSVGAVAFSPDSKSMAFINSTETAENIFVANSAFGNQRKILDNNIPNLEISWSSQNLIALKTKSSYAVNGFLYTINASGGNFAKVTESTGLDAVWNSDGSSVAYTNSNLDLFFLDMKTGNKKSLGLKTVAEKCAFGNPPAGGQKNIVYCAIPSVIASGKYPDEWWQGKASFLDNIIAIDTETLDLVLYAKTVSDAVDPIVLENDSFLLFKDKNTGELWSLKLR